MEAIRIDKTEGIIGGLKSLISLSLAINRSAYEEFMYSILEIN